MATSARCRAFVNPQHKGSSMPKDRHAPVIAIDDLPDFHQPIALHGARLHNRPALGVNDDLWIIAVIMVYENAH